MKYAAAFFVILIYLCLAACAPQGSLSYPRSGSGGLLTHERQTMTGPESGQPAVVVAPVVAPPVVTRDMTVTEYFLPAGRTPYDPNLAPPAPLLSRREAVIREHVTPGKLLAPARVVTPAPLKGESTTADSHAIRPPDGPAGPTLFNDDGRGAVDDKAPPAQLPATVQPSATSILGWMFRPLALLGIGFIAVGGLSLLLTSVTWWPIKTVATAVLSIGLGVGCLVLSAVLTATPFWVYWAIGGTAVVIGVVEYFRSPNFKAAVDAEVGTLMPGVASPGASPITPSPQPAAKS